MGALARPAKHPHNLAGTFPFPNLAQKNRARRSAPKVQEEPHEETTTVQQDKLNLISDQLPKPAACIDCREISAVDAIPCMRSLNSSEFEAFSRAVS
jgi:hypothetical protein